MKNTAVALATLLVVLAACSDDSTTTTSSSSSQSFKCCVNGSYFECASQEAMSHCGKSDVADFCPRAASKDDQCK